MSSSIQQLATPTPHRCKHSLLNCSLRNQSFSTIKSHIFVFFVLEENGSHWWSKSERWRSGRKSNCKRRRTSSSRMRKDSCLRWDQGHIGWPCPQPWIEYEGGWAETSAQPEPLYGCIYPPYIQKWEPVSYLPSTLCSLCMYTTVGHISRPLLLSDCWPLLQ
jgi:hypothetical protein